MEMIEFEKELEKDDETKTVGVTVKFTPEEREMFHRISKRERRNMSVLGQIIITEWLDNYINEYKENK